MARRSRTRAGSGHTNTRSDATSPVSSSATSGRFVTAAPVRTKAASARLSETLKSLGADPKVVDAAGRD